jgi:hypothetical protein
LTIETVLAGPVGVFIGSPQIEWHGEIEYRYVPTHRFLRPVTNEVIAPWQAFETDGGSIPRVLWNLPRMNPWTYFPAYVLHDWLFSSHEKAAGVPCTFDDANFILAEALLTLLCPRKQIVMIYEAVQHFGRPYWI